MVGRARSVIVFFSWWGGWVKKERATTPSRRRKKKTGWRTPPPPPSHPLLSHPPCWWTSPTGSATTVRVGGKARVWGPGLSVFCVMGETLHRAALSFCATDPLPPRRLNGTRLRGDPKGGGERVRCAQTTHTPQHAPTSIPHSPSHQSGAAIFTVDVHPSGIRFATGGGDARVRVWSLAPLLDAGAEAAGAPRALATLTDGVGAVNALRFSPDGARLAAGSDRGAACIYELRGVAAPGGAGGGGAPLSGDAPPPRPLESGGPPPRPRGERDRRRLVPRLAPRGHCVPGQQGGGVGWSDGRARGLAGRPHLLRERSGLGPCVQVRRLHRR